MHHTEQVQVVVDLGNTYIRVMSVSAHGAAPPTSRVLDAGGRMPSQVATAADGTWSWGVDRAPGRTVVGGFLARVDDPVPLVIGDVPVSAAHVVARQLEDAVALVAAECGPPSLLTVIHPDDLSPDARKRVEAALGTDLPVRWTSRATASIDEALDHGEVAVGDVVAALHVGGASCVATVWALTPSPRRLAVVRGDGSCAGGAVDDLVVAHVRRGVGAHDDGDAAALRASCEEAKTALSTETSVDVAVGADRVRIVRAELEELCAPLLERRLDSLAQALRLADVDPAALRTVLLTGGGASAPCFVEAIGARFAAPARLMTGRASTIGHDPTVVARSAPEGIAAAPATAPVRPARRPFSRVAATRLPGRRVGTPSWAGTGLVPPRRIPVVVGSAFVAVLVVGGGAVQQAGLVGMLATALGSDGPSATSARTLASGVVAPWLDILPELPESLVVAIEDATRSVTGGDTDTDTDSTNTDDTVVDTVMVKGPGAQANQPTRGSTPPRTPGGTTSQPGTPSPAATPAGPDPTPDADPTPVPTADPDPTPDPAPDPTPEPDPPPDPAPDPTPDPDPAPGPVDNPTSDGSTGGLASINSDPGPDPTITAPDAGSGDGVQP